MSQGSLFIANLVALLLFGALLGVLLRGRASRCWSFTAYLALALITNRLVCWWPERFFRLWFASLKELMYAALMVVITLELAWVALARFPRARRQAISIVAAVGGVVAVLVSTTRSEGLQARIGTTTALANSGALLVLVVLLAVVYWYHLPLESWHRVIAQGFVLYGGAYGVLLGAVGLFGHEAYGYLVALDPAAYAATVGLWVLAAWRPEAAAAPITASTGAPRSVAR
jgi:fluoride ion exporter CrcB/FEX